MSGGIARSAISFCHKIASRLPRLCVRRPERLARMMRADQACTPRRRSGAAPLGQRGARPPVRSSISRSSLRIWLCAMNGRAFGGSGALPNRKPPMRRVFASKLTSWPSGDGSMPSSRENAIGACSAPMVATTGPRTPPVAQVGLRSGRSGKTARRLALPPQQAAA